MKKMHYVNLYEIHSCYGGSEEGGWWYSAGEPVGCKSSVFSEGTARENTATHRV